MRSNRQELIRSFFAMTEFSRRLYRPYLKRVIDLVGGLSLLAVIWPVLLIIAVSVRLSLGSPVLFRQTRPGRLGKPFTIYKFRTMTDEKDPSGSLLRDQDRITWMGRMIRSFSLDELPEIFNVIRGEMSFVGPRPLLMRYLERYAPEQARRNEVVPGITGWAQVNGRNGLTWEEKFTLDVWYVDHQSFVLDVRIVLITIWKVLAREGISSEGFVGGPEFMGTDAKPKTDLDEHGTTKEML